MVEADRDARHLAPSDPPAGPDDEDGQQEDEENQFHRGQSEHAVIVVRGTDNSSIIRGCAHAGDPQNKSVFHQDLR
ncbi:hypothetical protein GCM10010486_07670 [Nonomuraea roseoviolacea subsp. carminata]